MQTKVEGLILSKTPYQERHSIARLLLRNGKRISVMFYGGQGGGAKKKGTTLEIGNMLRLEVSQGKRTDHLYKAREWMALWYHKQIRYQHKAFYLMCFMVELIEKLSIDDDLHDANRLEIEEASSGLFSVLSNAIFSMDQRLEVDQFKMEGDLCFFLAKLLIEQGVFPQMHNCCLCSHQIQTERSSVLLPEKGGFACEQCMHGHDGHRDMDHFDLHQDLLKISQTKYIELKNYQIKAVGVERILVHYVLYQMHMRPSHFRSLSLLL